MTTAVDTNILLDILTKSPDHWISSTSKVRDALREGEVIVGEVVFAELSPGLADEDEVRSFIEELGIAYRPSRFEALHRAGAAFRAYLQRRIFRCQTCGVPVEVACSDCGTLVTGRQHIVADFMVGAHALVHAGRLVTRDRGYYGTYFPELKLL
jgi:predicted nucleic acid-binding protein